MPGRRALAYPFTVCTLIGSDLSQPITWPSGAKCARSIKTFNAGDEPEANGRIEGEINQFKRRLRLLLAETGVSHDYWPCAARHGVEERLRAQMRKLGAKCKEMPPFAVLAQVKAKLWHRRKEGAFVIPLQDASNYGPFTSDD